MDLDLTVCRTVRKLAIAASFLVGVSLVAPAQAATIGPGIASFDNIALACQGKSGKKNKCVASAVLIENAGKDTEAQFYEDVFGDEVVVWDKVDGAGSASQNGLVTAQIGFAPGDTENGENRWFVSDPIFDVSAILGFSFTAGTYSVFFSFIAPGLEAGDDVRFNDLDYYAELLLSPEELSAKGSNFNAGFSHLTVYGLSGPSIVAVPVPAALPLFLTAFAVFGFIARRKS